MKLSHSLIRAEMGFLTLNLRLHPSGEAPVRSPGNFVTYTGELPEDDWLGALAGAYAEVFAQRPWNEVHRIDSVVGKVKRECTDDGCLTILRGNRDVPVGGFCWGATIPVEAIPPRAAAARGKAEERFQVLVEHLHQVGIANTSNVLYVDELAVLREFRGGVGPIQFVLRPILEYTVGRGVKPAIFWTSKESKILALAIYMGFVPICQIGEIVFLLNRDVTPLLKIAQNLTPEHVRMAMALTFATYQLTKWL